MANKKKFRPVCSRGDAVSTAIIKGWCPGAYAPMMSGDGLVVRVRPRLGRLSPDQTLGLCELAIRYGNGFLDLTNRANLQIRAVREEAHDDLLAELAALDLLDADPTTEQRRNLLTTPFWRAGDLTDRIGSELIRSLPKLPDLPAKFGFAVDTGIGPVLLDASADIRIERATSGLLVRADGMPHGRAVQEEEVIGAVLDFAQWFAEHQTPECRRMASVIETATPPLDWTGATPLNPQPRPVPGSHLDGRILGAPLGQIEARALGAAIEASRAKSLRVMPWRLMLFEAASAFDESAFISSPSDALLRANACPGAPFCPQASVETRDIARGLAPRLSGSLHVSGCAKGCAKTSRADVTLVGHEGRFDLVREGNTNGRPVRTGIAPDDVLTVMQDIE